MMPMWFWWDYNLKNLLFYGLNIKSVGLFIVTCFVLCACSLFFEWMKLLQAKVRQRRILLTQRQLQTICPPNEEDIIPPSLNIDQPSTSTGNTLPENGENRPPVFIMTRKHQIQHFIYDVGLWLTQNVVGYLLMVIVMLYNGYIVIAIVIGSAIGYFIFGPAVIKLNIQNCRMMRNTFCMADCGEPDKMALLSPTDATEDRQAGQTSPICHKSITAVVSETATQVLQEN